MNQAYRSKFLLIDDAFLLGVHNLQRKVNQAVKHPEPVMRLDAPWDNPTECFTQLNVLYDGDEKTFKMWYVLLAPADQWSANSSKWAYATSQDGIHWERPLLERIEHNGSKDNNYFTPPLDGFFGSIIIDPSDIASRRYKMLFEGNATDWASFHVPVCLAYSADGIVWDRPTHVNPVLRGLSDGLFVFYYDRCRMASFQRALSQ